MLGVLHGFSNSREGALFHTPSLQMGKIKLRKVKAVSQSLVISGQAALSTRCV